MNGCVSVEESVERVHREGSRNLAGGLSGPTDGIKPNGKETSSLLLSLEETASQPVVTPITDPLMEIRYFFFCL